jgi:hypothetical protein
MGNMPFLFKATIIKYFGLNSSVGMCRLDNRFNRMNLSSDKEQFVLLEEQCLKNST